MPPEATGLVLAGGRSSRLGRDKAREQVGGKSLLLRAVDAVAWCCREVLVAGDPEGREDLPLPPEARWVSDVHPGRGPLSGLHAGLTEARHDYVVAVGCDMPFLNPLLLEALLRLAPGHDAVVPWLGGKHQPLHAVYARPCLPAVERLLAGDDQAASLRELISLLRVRYVMEPELRPLDPDLRSFFNINTEDDLSRARRMLTEAGPL